MPKSHSPAAAEIGDRIREAREELGISMEDLGILSEINWTTIGRIERGESSPAVETLIRIATALEIDAGAFVSGITADGYGSRVRGYSARDFLKSRDGARGGAREDVGDSASDGVTPARKLR